MGPWDHKYNWNGVKKEVHESGNWLHMGLQIKLVNAPRTLGVRFPTVREAWHKYGKEGLDKSHGTGLEQRYQCKLRVLFNYTYTNIKRYIHMKCIYILYMSTFICSEWRINVIAVGMSIYGDSILISKYYYPIQVTNVPWKIGWF